MSMGRALGGLWDAPIRTTFRHRPHVDEAAWGPSTSVQARRRRTKSGLPACVEAPVACWADPVRTPQDQLVPRHAARSTTPSLRAGMRDTDPIPWASSIGGSSEERLLLHAVEQEP